MKKLNFAAVASCLLLSLASHAAVEKVEIRERVPFAEGKSFGDVGVYEKIRGVATFALDPKLAANASIVDLKYAPRDPKGRVKFSSEFVMLRPTHGKPSTLLYDVNNRGGIAIHVDDVGRTRSACLTESDIHHRKVE